MKYSALACLMLGAQAVQLNGIWDDSMAGVDASDYNKSAPKAYAEKEKQNQIDFAKIEREKLQKEQAEKDKADKAEQSVKDKEDMNIELLTFTKTLDTKNF